MNFSEALTAAKRGRLITREGWNGKGMFVFMVDGSEFQVSRAPLNKIFPEGTKITYRPHLDMKYADGTIGVWNPSNSDLLEEDWRIVSPPDASEPI